MKKTAGESLQKKPLKTWCERDQAMWYHWIQNWRNPIFFPGTMMMMIFDGSQTKKKLEKRKKVFYSFISLHWKSIFFLSHSPLFHSFILIFFWYLIRKKSNNKKKSRWIWKKKVFFVKSCSKKKMLKMNFERFQKQKKIEIIRFDQSSEERIFERFFFRLERIRIFVCHVMGVMFV